MPAEVSNGIRAELLNIARGIVPLCDRANAVTVAATAVTLLEWLEAAPDDDDAGTRYDALKHQARNDSGTGDVRAFLDGARVFHDFLAAGQEAR